MTGHDSLMLLLALATLLLAGRLLGELALRFRQPPILGEILAGILLGPTVLGRLAPESFGSLFPASGPVAIAREGLAMFAVTLFMFVAGMEVDLSTVWRRGRAALTVSLAGIVVPFALGLGAALLVPVAMGREPDANETVFALFFATALAISALPVIARTLLDLNLYRSDLGMVVIAAAIVDDLVGWIVFAVILALIGQGGHDIGSTIAMVLGYAALMLTLGRWLIDRSLPFLQAHLSWPAGVLGFAVILALLGAATTEWIGVHALFGAFLAGVALGDSRHLRERMRSTIDQFVTAGLAPLFFTTIGLKVDFVSNFDAGLTALVLVIACAGKVLGCGLGARWAGMPQREAWAVGFGMNARGAMEIILGLIALRAGIIGERLFVALVIMALATSVMSGPLMEAALARPRPRRLVDLLLPGTFKCPLIATTREDAILHLAGAMAEHAHLPVPAVQRAVLDRERLQATGLGDGVAVPHARIAGLSAPLVGVGVSRFGLDFDAPDGQPVHLVFMLLTAPDDDSAQVELLADIGRIVRSRETRERALEVTSFTELRALLRVDGAASHA
jgi:Kef-type K+ transport system membrane component KefB/mannitol/fructose-specific phosphotransferase system IIA component (Ntr-type)